MALHLVVQVPFWHYERGSTISDPAEIEKVMEHHGHFVTQAKAPDDPAPVEQMAGEKIPTVSTINFS